MPAIQKLYDKVLQAVAGFFFVQEAALRLEGTNIDPLVAMAQQDAWGVMTFVRSVMLISGAFSVVVSAACAVFLALYWDRCGDCERPLRWWLLLQMVLQVFQIPVRYAFVTRLRHAEQVGSNFEVCVAGLTGSLAWQFSKNVAIFTYAWFVLGVVWVVNSGGCTVCPGVYWMTVCVILQAVARAFVAFYFFRELFPLAVGNEPHFEAPRLEGATPIEILSLPLVEYQADLFKEPGAMCVVCIAEYEDGDTLRRLPCSHFFHSRCADRWLHRSKKCPLCMQSISSPVATCQSKMLSR